MTLHETRIVEKRLLLKVETLKNTKENSDELLYLEEDLKIVRSWISNLTYVIMWLKIGKNPESRRGIERRAAYEREIPFDPYWIQLKKDETCCTFESEIEEIDDFKEDLVKEIIKPLNKKEKEIFELVANNFSIREIANYLHIPKSTVADTIQRCKRKIEDEGWEIV